MTKLPGSHRSGFEPLATRGSGRVLLASGLWGRWPVGLIATGQRGSSTPRTLGAMLLVCAQHVAPVAPGTQQDSWRRQGKPKPQPAGEEPGPSPIPLKKLAREAQGGLGLRAATVGAGGSCSAESTGEGGRGPRLCWDKAPQRRSCRGGSNLAKESKAPRQPPRRDSWGSRLSGS